MRLRLRLPVLGAAAAAAVVAGVLAGAGPSQAATTGPCCSATCPP